MLSDSSVGELQSYKRLDPEYIDAAIRLYEYPLLRRALSERDQALILLSLEVLVTQLQARAHPSADRWGAVGRSASYDEILATVELASVVGLHSISYGLPRLQQVLESRGEAFDAERKPDRAERIAAHEARGYRGMNIDGMLSSILHADPEYFERFTSLLEIPWLRVDVLDNKLKQMICIAIDACCSHLYEEGLIRHYHEALDAGVTPAQIVEVLQLCSITGLRSLEVSLPILGAELAESDAEIGQER